MSTRLVKRAPDLFNYRPLSDEQCRFYEQQGYLLLGQTLTDQGLSQMRRQCMDAWAAEKGQFDPTQTWLINALLTNIHHRSQVVRQFYFDGPIVDVAGQLIGPNVKAATSQLTFKMRGNTMPFGWHQDNGYGQLEPYNAISTLTVLDDTDEENGCLWIIPCSHRNQQIQLEHSVHDREANRDIDLEVDETGKISVPMQAGQSLIFNCWMLHRSEGNHAKVRDRRVLFMRYADADAVEVYNDRKPRLGKLLRGTTRFTEVENYEAELG